MSETAEPSEAARRIVADADRCVQCGLCLPVCPTYALLREEADSPRGRIALARALASGALAADPVLAGHLRRCLLCRACEAMCPARVPFARIMDAARARIPDADRSGPLRRLLRRPRLLRAGVRALRAAHRMGLTAAARLPLLPAPVRRAAALLPTPPRPVRVAGRRAGPEAGPRVWLFPGCTGEALDGRTLADALDVLAALGFRVRVPEDHVCCGALALHAGRPAEARALAARAARALADDGEAPVVAVASGCALTLAEADALGQPGLAARARELTAFLAATPWPRTPRLRPVRLRVLAHAPCSLAHGLRAGAAVEALLARVPGLEVVRATDAPACCGGAGAYAFEEPELSAALRAQWAERLAALRPQAVATPNLGCALQLGAAAREAGLALEVLHPVSLLARALGRA